MRACTHPKSQLETLFPAQDYITGDRFEIARCRGCGFAVTTPQPADLVSYYPAGYYGAPGGRRFPALVEAMQQWLYARRVRGVESVAGAGRGRVLDVGCGRGLLLKEFQRRGWTVQGTELSEGGAAYAREVLGLEVSIGELSSLCFPPNHFDVVTLWHVLEHLPDPRVLLAEVNRILKPGGVLFVGVPNFGGCEARVCRAGWFHLDVPRHLTHFTQDDLAKAVKEAGFGAQSWSGFAPEYDVFSFVQSVLNRVGLRQNLLYNFLRRGPAKVLGEGAPWWQLPATLLLAAAVGVVSIPATLLAGCVQQGGTLTVVANKLPSNGFGERE